jgi:type IV pilus assembly protein PilY1
MAYRKLLNLMVTALAALSLPLLVEAQTNVSEDFTGATTTNSWYFFNGACLTASTNTGAEPTDSSAGQVPGCTTIVSSYYDNAVRSQPGPLIGGYNGTFPDPVGNGALRFTNGHPYGNSENGAIIFATPFPTGQGVAITFKTVTYLGDSGGAANDGADGMSFYLMDASQLNTALITSTSSTAGNGLGAWGGSLAYTCSNANVPYNGLIGGYIGLGIDEYGNFLNGTTNTLAESGTTASGDNTASGGGYMPGRIGVRGAGNIAWATLNEAYGGTTNPGSSKPYYPNSLNTSCHVNGGTYSAGLCSGNATDAMVAVQKTCANGNLYNYNSLAVSPYSNSPTAVGTTSLTNTVNTGSATNKGNQTVALFPVAPILDYTALPGGYTVLPWATFTASISGTVMNVSAVSYGALAVGQPVSGAGVPAGTVISSFGTGTGGTGKYNLNNSVTIGSEAMTMGTQIASESATTRPLANTIFYQLKVSEDGLLSLSYSINGGIYQQVIKQQNITTANGPLPADFLFGFAGSSGGSSNIHEILCFKAQPNTSAASSAGASEKQSAKLETGSQVYFAYYDPNNGWTGDVTASGLGYNTYGNVVVAATPNWDASCNLTGVASGATCSSTGAAGPITAQNYVTGGTPNGRVVLSWNGTSGVPFEWGNLTGAQQAVIDAGDATPLNATRVNYLRGQRSNEVSTSGVGLYRRRDSVLADIVDASPIWVGPPNLSYPATWGDRLNPSATPAENGSSAQTYPLYTSTEQTRLNVVYAGADDGMVHGFRSGSYDVNNNFVSTDNDGMEVLAYVPGAVVQTIHSTTASVDYANTQYGHNFFVDATPGTGDLFFQNQWHSWLVGGLGPGGSAVYALDVTTPTATNFTEANAASVVVGEWTPSTLTCANVSNCGNNLGNTYGTPVIRRLHDGKWGVIFGNGYGSTSGDAGIFVMTVDPNTAAKTFYYFSTSTGSASSPNGIAYASAADLDGDHITDYVYAGDLQGNLWRFDLTAASESSWGVTTPGPLFKTPTGQPITTAIAGAVGAPAAGMQQQLMLMFGTGQKTPLTASSPATYTTGTQSFYGVWDWNMSSWNAKSSATYASLAPGTVGTITHANLVQQTITVNATTLNRDITTNATPCWSGQSGCTGSSAQYGWYINFPGTQEQVIYSPELIAPAVTVNSILPAPNNPTSCTTVSDEGFTYVLNAMTGGAYPYAFYPSSISGQLGANPNQTLQAQLNDQYAAGIQTNATGTSVVVTGSNGNTTLVYQNNQSCGTSGTCQNVSTLNVPSNVSGRRVSWIERR